MVLVCCRFPHLLRNCSVSRLALALALPQPLPPPIAPPAPRHHVPPRHQHSGSAGRRPRRQHHGAHPGSQGQANATDMHGRQAQRAAGRRQCVRGAGRQRPMQTTCGGEGGAREEASDAQWAKGRKTKTSASTPRQWGRQEAAMQRIRRPPTFRSRRRALTSQRRGDRRRRQTRENQTQPCKEHDLGMRNGCKIKEKPMHNSL